MANPDEAQISFRTTRETKRKFEMALAQRSLRTMEKATAVEVLTELVEGFIAEEEKLRG